MARRYDSRTTIFSPEGRLYQVRVGEVGGETKKHSASGTWCPRFRTPARSRAAARVQSCVHALSRSRALALSQKKTLADPFALLFFSFSQVEYAMEAISNAGSAIGVLAKDGVVLAAEKRITSKVRGGERRRERGAGAHRKSTARIDDCLVSPYPPYLTAARHQRRRRAPRKDVPAGRPRGVRGGRDHG